MKPLEDASTAPSVRINREPKRGEPASDVADPLSQRDEFIHAARLSEATTANVQRVGGVDATEEMPLAPPKHGVDPWQVDDARARFAAPNGPLLALDAELAPCTRSTEHDIYHDVGMYRGKTQDEAIENCVRILSNGYIVGMTQKGAQVSANAGPTNWFESQMTLRIKRTPEEQPGLMPDDNCPRGANWYATMSPRVRLPIDVREVEVIVNGQTPQQIDVLQHALERKLATSGLGQIPVVPIQRFLNARFQEIARHLPAESRDGFLRMMGASPLWSQKVVGELAGKMGDAAYASWRENDAIKIYEDTHAQLVKTYVDRGDAALGKDIADRFMADAELLTEGEQVALARRLTMPYTYALEAIMDGYERYGTGLRNALPEGG